MTPYIVRLPSGMYFNLGMAQMALPHDDSEIELSFGGFQSTDGENTLNSWNVIGEDASYLLSVLDHLAALASPIPATAKED